MFKKILSVALLIAVLSVMVVTPTFAASDDDDVRAKVEDTIMAEEEVRRLFPDPGPKKVEIMSQLERINLEIIDIDKAPERYPVPLEPMQKYTCYLNGFHVPCYLFKWFWDVN